MLQNVGGFLTIYGGYGYKMAKKQLPLFHLTCSQCCFFPNSWIDPQHFTQVLVAFWNLVDLDVVHWWPLGPWTLHWDGDFWWQLFDLWVLKAKILAKKYHQISIPFRQDPAFGKAPSASAPCSASKLPGSCRCISCSAKLSCEAYRKIAMSATKIWNLRKKNWKFRFLPTRMNT